MGDLLGMVWLKMEVEEFEQKESKFAKERMSHALNTEVSPKVAPIVPCVDSRIEFEQDFSLTHEWQTKVRCSSSNWLDYVNTSETEGEPDAARNCVKRGSPYGTGS